MNRVAKDRLHGEIETARPLLAREGKVAVIGWCLNEDLPVAPPVRLTTPAGTLPMTSRLDRNDVPRLFPSLPAAGQCGFAIEGVLPAGVYPARFEAQTTDGSWQCFKTLSLAVEPTPFRAALDEPIGQGILCDRVRVGGWALQSGETLSELVLRYGHRELPCTLLHPRNDLPALFPEAPNAVLAGFESRDCLVAGHGPVRLRGRLANGRIVIASTKVIFSIPTDENHGPELDLTASRTILPGGNCIPTDTPPLTDRPLNILFVLHGSFGSNSALHVAALANELVAAGHACAVAVPEDIETLAHHVRPLFRGLTYEDAERSLTFANGRDPDLIHAWTTRENVRQLTQKLADRHRSKIVVHLEDNEQEILALSLGRNFSDLEKLSDAELEQLVPADLSHPRHARRFLAASHGATVITDRLREFLPPGHACLTLSPAADSRYFFPRSIPREFRQVLDVVPHTTVLFYHGNVHASNAAEMRELYTAVLQLNGEGHPVTLIRTGLDRVDFLGPIAGEVAPFVIELGQIRHQWHPALMALADIFVQPGRPDAFNDYRFPSKLPEFFSLGRPVVLPRTNLGASLRHGIDAYVLDQADAAGIVRAVRELRCDRLLYDRLAQGAADFAAQHFSWRRTAQALAKFYAALTV